MRIRCIFVFYYYRTASLQMIFSSGKNVEAICIACLIDRGLLNYNDKVSRHWPGRLFSDVVSFISVMQNFATE